MYLFLFIFLFNDFLFCTKSQDLTENTSLTEFVIKPKPSKATKGEVISQFANTLKEQIDLDKSSLNLREYLQNEIEDYSNGESKLSKLSNNELKELLQELNKLKEKFSQLNQQIKTITLKGING